MSLGLIFILFVLGIILFAVIVSKVGPRVDKRSTAQSEQEIQGVGADQKEEDPEDRKKGPGLMG